MKELFGMEHNPCSWLEAQMKDTLKVLQHKLQELNEMEDVSSKDLDDIKDIYKTFYYIACLSKDMNK